MVAVRRGTSIATLGDLLLDVIVRLETPLERGADTHAVTRAGAGGQAANVAAWAVELGAQARFIGKRGNDAAGQLVAAELAARGVEVLGPAVGGRNGVVVSIVDAAGDRTMASDRGVAPDLRPEELDAAWFGGVDWLHLTGYALYRPPIEHAAATAVDLARDAGARISADLSAATRVREYGPDRLRRRLEELALDLLFANEDELDALGGELPAAAWVVKKGAAGIEASDGTAHAAPPVNVVDTTGAGDALAAGFLVGGAELGLQAAARCVAQLGTMP